MAINQGVLKPFDSTGEVEFRIDVPPGEYTLYVMLGDYYYQGAGSGFMDYLGSRYSIKINGKEHVSVQPSEKEVVDLFYGHEYEDYKPGISYWRRYVKPFFERTTHSIKATSDGSLSITMQNMPINMIAVWPKAESGEAEQWLRELEKIREESCEFREVDRPAVKPLRANPEQKEKGYVVFSADYMEDFSPYTVPEEKNIGADVKLFAARNELEPAVFGIYPFKDLKDVHVKVSDLRNERGGLFPCRNVDVRFGKYIEDPGSLIGFLVKEKDTPRMRYSITSFAYVSRETIPVYEGATQQCWLTFTIPEETPSGDYEGRIEVIPANAPSTTLKLLLKVLPFRLPTLSELDKYIELSFSYINPRHPNIWPGTDEQELSKRLMKSWNNDGFNVAGLPLSAVTARLEGGTLAIDVSAVEKWLKGWEDAGVRLKAVSLCNWLVGKTGELIKKEIPGYRDRFNPKVTEFPAEFDKMYMELAQMVDQEFAKRKWPQPLFYDGGEGGGWDNGRYYEKHLHGLLHRAGVKNTLSVSGDFAYLQEIAPLVWAPYDYYFNLEHFIWMKEHNINICFMAKYNRFERGLFMWRIGAKATYAECYCYPGNCPYVLNDTLAGDYGLVLPTRDGNGINPTPASEKTRAGHDDARYLLYLEQLITKAEATGKDKDRQAAGKAKEVLDKIRETIDPDLDHYRNFGAYPSSGIYQKIRWRVSREIVKLEETLQMKE